MDNQTTKKKEQVIEVRMVLFGGEFEGDDLPLETVLRRKLHNIAKDGNRFRVKNFEFKQDELDESCPFKQDNDED
jgi:hypothetical protein